MKQLDDDELERSAVVANCRWFEFLILEVAQAGLSWDTILRKRAAYRRAFAGFDPEAVAGFDEARIESLLADPGIARNRLKDVLEKRADLEMVGA